MGQNIAPMNQNYPPPEMNYSKEQSPPSMANAQGNHMPMGGLNQMNANNMMNPPQENPYLQQHQPKG